MEEVDNKNDYDGLTLSPSSAFKTIFDPTLLNGVVKIDVSDFGKKFLLIPYYSWDNRDAGKMKVWIDYK
jgi:hypothetical protein